jgi:hypothetical protein
MRSSWSISSLLTTYSRQRGATAHCGEKMTNQSQFFKEQRPAAVLKHGILHRYLRVFASKTGSTAPGHRVAYLDGYSGPGQYQGRVSLLV